MAKWKTLSKKAAMKKGDQIWYGKDKFGFYVKMQKAHISIPKGKSHWVAPFGILKNRTYVGIWDPHAGFGSDKSLSTFIPKSKITKIRRVIK